MACSPGARADLTPADGGSRAPARGGYVLYFRHAATDFSQNDARMTSFEDCSDAAQPHRPRSRRCARDRRRDPGAAESRSDGSARAPTAARSRPRCSRSAARRSPRRCAAVRRRPRTPSATPALRELLATAARRRGQRRDREPRQLVVCAAVSRRGRGGRASPGEALAGSGRGGPPELCDPPAGVAGLRARSRRRSRSARAARDTGGLRARRQRSGQARPRRRISWT